MSYPIPPRFINYVAEKARGIGGDAEIEVSLDWLRERIKERREQIEEYYEKEEALRQAPDD